MVCIKTRWFCFCPSLYDINQFDIYSVLCIIYIDILWFGNPRHEGLLVSVDKLHRIFKLGHVQFLHLLSDIQECLVTSRFRLD